jgi:hypothetical protein
VTAKTTHLISTADEVKKNTTKVVQATGKGVHIVEEEFLEACKQFFEGPLSFFSVVLYCVLGPFSARGKGASSRNFCFFSFLPLRY